MPTVYAVASGKGGVGKTTTTAALGSVLAAAGHGVVAVDCDLGMPNLAPALGVDDEPPGLHEVLAGEASLADAIRESPVGVDVVPGSRDIDAYRDSNPAEISDAVDLLVEAGGYDYVLLDTGAGLSHDNVLPLSVADAVLLVSTVDRDALKDAERTREVSARVGGYAAGLVLTRVREDQDTGIAEQIVDTPVLATVPEDPEAAGALAVGTPLPAFAPHSAAAAAYRTLATDLTGESIPDPDPPAATDADEGTDAGDDESEEDAAADESEEGAAADESEEGAADEEADAAGSAPSSAPAGDAAGSGVDAGGAAIPDAEGGTAPEDPEATADAPEVDLTAVEVSADDDASSPLAGAMAEAEAMVEADAEDSGDAADADATAGADDPADTETDADEPAADDTGVDADDAVGRADEGDADADDAAGAAGQTAADADADEAEDGAVDDTAPDDADGAEGDPGVQETTLAGADAADADEPADDDGEESDDDGERKGFFSRLFG